MPVSQQSLRCKYTTEYYENKIIIKKSKNRQHMLKIIGVDNAMISFMFTGKFLNGGQVSSPKTHVKRRL